MVEKLGTYYWIDDVKTEVQESYRFTSAPVYEVIRIMEGVPLFYDAHIKRLIHSLELKKMNYQVDDNSLLKLIVKWAEDHNLKSFNVRIEIGLNSQYQEVCVIMGVKPHYPQKEVYLEGVHVVLGKWVRNNPHAKVLYSDYQDYIAQIKKSTNAFEVLLQDELGKLSEGSRSNLFWIKEDTIYSAKSEDVLLGISREVLLEVINEQRFIFVERDIYKEEIASFDAAFLSGTSIHLLPIASIDALKLASPQNKTFIKLMHAFEDKVDASIHSMKERILLW